MKTQRRHELETNKLADWLAKNADHYKSHARTFLIVVAGAIAIFFAALVFRSTRAANEGAAWRNFYNAFAERSPEALTQVAKDASGTKVSLWAKQAAADSQLARGMTGLFTDRDEANKYLKDAEKNLQEVEAGAGDDQTLLERARFGLGQVYESLGDLGSAKKYYGLVAKTSPESALGKVATERAKLIGDPEMEEWYAWFSQQKPKPPQPQPPVGTGPGANPSVLGPGGTDSLRDLPKTSDLPSLEKQFPSLNKPATYPDPDPKSNASDPPDGSKSENPGKAESPPKAEENRKPEPAPNADEASPKEDSDSSKTKPDLPTSEANGKSPEPESSP